LNTEIFPVYPEFRSIKVEDLPVFNSAFKDDPPLISEFTFTNIYAWREVYNFKVSALEGQLILLSELGEKKRFFPPIGKGNTKKNMAAILTGGKGKFIRVPEEIKQMFEEEERFAIEPDRDNSDYLYRADDLIKLPGRKYDGKRNLINKLKSTYTYEYSGLGASHIEDCLEFEERWCTIRNCDSVEGLDNERRAIREMVNNFSLFSLIVGAIRIEDRICAVAIGQRLNPETLVMHVLKADPEITGLYQAMSNEFLLANGRDFDYVNMEQDLGVEGIRKAKLSYHPLRIVNKYDLFLRGGQ